MSPRGSLCNSYGNGKYFDDISLSNLSRSSSLLNSSSGHLKSNCSPVNSIAFSDQLPPRIEQDLEGKQFVIPRNNAYVQENARLSWSSTNDPLKRRSFYLDNHQLASTLYCYPPRSNRQTPSITTPSPTSFAAPPPYPGKKANLDSDSVISLGSLRSASGVLASVNANHNYANIDILKNNFNPSSSHILGDDLNKLQDKAPPPPPYPSSAVRNALKLTNDSAAGKNNNSTPELPNKQIHASADFNIRKTVSVADILPPPPPYPSSAVRAQGFESQLYDHQSSVHQV